jgi:hypothetical protein
VHPVGIGGSDSGHGGHIPIHLRLRFKTEHQLAGDSYTAIESNEQPVYEMLRWFDKYVKDAPPRNLAASR